MKNEPQQALVLLIGEVLEDPRVYKTCRSLMQNGAQVTVCCTSPSGRPQNETADGIHIIRVPHYRESLIKRLYNVIQSRSRSAFSSSANRLHEEVPASRIAAFVRNTAVMMNHRHVMQATRAINFEMVRRVARQRFDLVHANDVDTLAAGALLKRNGLTRKLLYDAHEFWPGIGVHGSLPNRDNQRLEARYINEADYVMTVNELIAERMQNLYNLPKTPSVVMNCPPLSETVQSNEGLHEPVRVLYQGKLQAFRGLEELIRAFHDIPDALLTFSGYGPIEERLKLLAASEGLTDRITFGGRYSPDQTLEIAAEHDIGVLPFSSVTTSIELSSPNKLFDYLMAGLAIATTDLPFLADLVERHDVGAVFAGNSPERIAEAINGLIADHERLIACKRRAQKAARKTFSWEHQFIHYPWSPSC